MLFFKPRKKGEISSGTAAAVERAPRYGSLALVNVNGYEGMAILRNVSQTGFRMESKTFVEMELGSILTMQITPEIHSGIKPFEIKVEVRWIVSTGEKFSAGFMLVQGGSLFFQRYVDFLKSSTRAA
jgi:hypothetical protein